MWNLYITLGRLTYNYGLFETDFIEQAKRDLQERYPDGKVFAIQVQVNVLTLSPEEEIIYSF